MENRKLPFSSSSSEGFLSSEGFFIAAGLEQALEFLEKVKFSDNELEWLSSSARFTDRLLGLFSPKFRFSGDVHAMPEGTAFFANEPILRITAPLPAFFLRGSPLTFAFVTRPRMLTITALMSSLATAAVRLQVNIASLYAPHSIGNGLYHSLCSQFGGINSV